MIEFENDSKYLFKLKPIRLRYGKLVEHAFQPNLFIYLFSYLLPAVVLTACYLYYYHFLYKQLKIKHNYVGLRRSDVIKCGC